jgi:8-oxo-dGTP pyrophosphatase MutT (NUDIX family)
MESIEKVTVFITRTTDAGEELLLIEHPYAGVQIPAGTVERGEPPLDAAFREATEETGLDELVLRRVLGARDEMLAEDERVLLESTLVYARPDRASFDWARLPRAATVQVERRAGDFLHITYREHDQLESPQYVSYQITGWIPHTAATQSRRRYFYHLTAPKTGPASWQHEADQHRWRLFWAPVARLPAVVSPDGWLAIFARGAVEDSDGERRGDHLQDGVERGGNGDFGR